jgi:hypothetical protein
MKCHGNELRIWFAKEDYAARYRPLAGMAFRACIQVLILINPENTPLFAAWQMHLSGDTVLKCPRIRRI